MIHKLKAEMGKEVELRAVENECLRNDDLSSGLVKCESVVSTRFRPRNYRDFNYADSGVIVRLNQMKNTRKTSANRGGDMNVRKTLTTISTFSFFSETLIIFSFKIHYVL